MQRIIDKKDLIFSEFAAQENPEKEWNELYQECEGEDEVDYFSRIYEARELFKEAMKIRKKGYLVKEKFLQGNWYDWNNRYDGLFASDIKDTKITLDI